MTAVLVSGGTGFVGRFVVEDLLARGDRVVVMSRRRPPEDHFSRPVEWIEGALDQVREWATIFADVDYFIHAAFAHVPGKYRGGEGDDPETFSRQNIDGSLTLFEAAKKAGVRRAVFLSSRAVYDGVTPGMVLTEDMPVSPNTLYGQVKRAVELGIAEMADDRFLPISLRVTGIYGSSAPGGRHKWSDMFDAFTRGEIMAPRVGSEVHGEDLAAAVRLLLGAPIDQIRAFGRSPCFNVSDFVLDRHDLLAAYAKHAKIDKPLPERADSNFLNVMDCSRLRGLGWSPKGRLELPE